MFAKNVLVAAAALVATVAAQAQSVTVYGNVEAAFGSFERGVAGEELTHRITRVESNVLTGSFLGFKGQEDLGGGLKAFFKLESTIGLDTGSVAGNFWGRTSEIGLTNAYGTLTAGNSLSLSALANHAQSPFSVFGSLNGVQNGVGEDFATVQANTLTVTSANYSGFSAALQYGASEAHGKDSKYALAANYAAGPLAANFTYTDDVDALNASRNLWQLGGSYNFGVAKAFVQVGQADLAGSNDTDFFQLGVSAPVTAAGTVLASWTHAKIDNAGKSDQLSAAYDHALSKRTGAFAGLAYEQFKPEGGDSKSGVSLAVGLHHAF